MLRPIVPVADMEARRDPRKVGVDIREPEKVVRIHAELACRLPSSASWLQCPVMSCISVDKFEPGAILSLASAMPGGRRGTAFCRFLQVVYR